MFFLSALRRRSAIGIAAAIWVLAVGFGVNVLWTYSITQGRPATPPLTWPKGAPIQRGERQATLLMFAHPHCQCTRATVGELAIMMAQTGREIDAQIFFYVPSNEATGWASTDLWRDAAAIPGVHVFADRDASAAKSFGVFTSGQTLLYDSGGRLLFKGGITAYRGHSGDNEGRSLLTALIRKEIPERTMLPLMTRVFGCSLRAE